jgi:hypothetical protein
MPRYAILTNGIVSNVIMADNLEIAEEVTGFLAIESDVANIGEYYDEKDETFSLIPEPIAIEQLSIPTE